MTTREDFLRAICADPADYSTRLIFADWLQENGEEEYGEFVKCQVQFALLQPRLGKEYHSSRGMSEKEGWDLHRLRRRELSLYEQHKGEWHEQFLWQLRRLNGYPWLRTSGINREEAKRREPINLIRAGDLYYQCGFVEIIHLSVNQWILLCDMIQAACPLREVVFSDTDFHGTIVGIESTAMRDLVDEAIRRRMNEDSTQIVGTIGRLGSDCVEEAWPGIKFWTLLFPPGHENGPWAGG